MHFPQSKIGTAWSRWRGTVLGIDAGTLKCGLALIDQQGSLRASGQYPLGTGDLGARLLRLEEIVLAWLSTEPYPTYIAVEKPINQPRYRSGGAAYVGQGFGVVCLSVARRTLTLLEISPSAAKMALTGRGGAKKDTMMDAARTQFALGSVGEDEADAIGIALAGLREVRRFLTEHEAGLPVGSRPAAHREAKGRR